MTEQEQMILRFPRDVKIGFLKEALNQDRFDYFFELAKIFLNAPISEGGLESEVIDNIHQEHLNNKS